MAVPTYTAQIALTANPLDALGTITWTDITADVKSVTIQRGRNHERNETQAGTCVMVLEDGGNAGKFDPENSLGAFYPNLKPMKRIRLVATYSAVSYQLFTGYIDSYKIRRMDAVSSQVEIAAYDAFKLFNLWQLQDPYFAEVMKDTPTLFARFSETGQPAYIKDWSGNNRHGLVFNPRTTGEDNIEMGYELGIEGATPGNKGIRFIDNGGDAARPYGRFDDVGVSGTDAATYSFFIQPKHTSTSIPAAFVLSETGDYLGYPSTDALAIVPLRDGGGRLLNLTLYIGRNGVAQTSVLFATPFYYDDLSYTRITLTRNGTTFRMLAGRPGNLVALGSAVCPVNPVLSRRAWIATPTGGSYTGYPFYSGPFDELSVHAGVLSDARIQAQIDEADGWEAQYAGVRLANVLDQIGWPAADRSLEAGETLLQPFIGTPSALSHMQAVAKTEDGLFFIDGEGIPTLYARRHRQTATRSITSQYTFGDNGGSEILYSPGVEPVLDEQDLWNEIVAEREGGEEQRVKDSTSVTSFGKRTLSETGLLSNDDSDPFDRATFKLSLYKDARARVRQLPFSRDDSDATFYTPATGIEMWDRVTFIQRLTGASTFTQLSLVEAVRYDLRGDTNKDLKVTLALAPIDAAVHDLGFWVMNTHELDSTTRLTW